MGSSRLPGKTMKKILGRTILEILLENVSMSKYCSGNLVVATTTDKRDDCIEKTCSQKGVKVFRGSEEDVVSRFHSLIMEYSPRLVVRITADNPLTSFEIIDKYVELANQFGYDYIYDGTNKFPLGMSAEVFRGDSFLRFYDKYRDLAMEHVSPLFTKNPDSNNFFYDNDSDYSRIRLTIDTDADFELLTVLADKTGKTSFRVAEIIDLFQKNENLNRINSHIRQITDGK